MDFDLAALDSGNKLQNYFIKKFQISQIYRTLAAAYI